MAPDYTFPDNAAKTAAATASRHHSVYSTLGREEAIFTSLSLDTVDAGIVHEEFQKIFLPANLGRIPNNVFVIPHGAKTAVAEDVPDEREAKRQFGYEGKKYVHCVSGGGNQTSGSKTWWPYGLGCSTKPRMRFSLLRATQDRGLLVGSITSRSCSRPFWNSPVKDNMGYHRGFHAGDQPSIILTPQK